MDEASRKRLLKKLRGTRSLSELGDGQWQKALGKEVPRSMWRSNKLAGMDKLCWSQDGRVLLVVMSNYETHFLETQHGAVLFSSQLRRPPPSDLRWLPALDSHLDDGPAQRRRCFAELIDCFCTMNFCLLYLQAAFDLAVEGWESKPGALVKDISSKLLPCVCLLKECQTSLHSALFLLRVDTSECEVGIDFSSRFLSTLLSIQSDPSTNFPDADEDALRNSTAASVLSDLADDLSSLEEVLGKTMRLVKALDDATTA